MNIPDLKSRKLSVLRRANQAALLMGTLGSVALVIWVGRNNHSFLLRMLFLLWVFSPFLGMLMAQIISEKWDASVRRMIYILTIIISMCSLFCYSGMFNPPRMKPAFKFLGRPLISWVIIGIAIPATAARSRKTAEDQDRM